MRARRRGSGSASEARESGLLGQERDEIRDLLRAEAREGRHYAFREARDDVRVRILDGRLHVLVDGALVRLLRVRGDVREVRPDLPLRAGRRVGVTAAAALAREDPLARRRVAL